MPALVHILGQAALLWHCGK